MTARGVEVASDFGSNPGCSHCDLTDSFSEKTRWWASSGKATAF